MRSFLAPALSIVLLTACEQPPMPGYSRLGEGGWYRRISLGDGDRLPNDSDRVALRLRMSLRNGAPGSLHSADIALDVHTVARSAFRAALLRMHLGDSISLLATADRLAWDQLGAPAASRPSDTTLVRTEMRLDGVKELKQVRAEEAERARRNRDRELEEQESIGQFLRERTSVPVRSWEGIHILHLEPGAGPLAQSGDLVTVDWVARFLDGRVFHDIRTSGQSMTFRLGDPEQVIHGLESVLHLLGSGGTAEVLIPSSEAFGERGASGGVVPPFTPVIYQLRVLEVAAATGP